MKGIRITKSNLIGVAIESVRHGKGLDEYREYVRLAKLTGLLSFRDDELERLIEENKELIFGKGIQKRELDEMLPSTTVIGDGIPNWSREVKLPHLGGKIDHPLDIKLLEKEIPDYWDLINPPPDKVYLLEYMCRVVDVIILQPLFKVVGVRGSGGIETGLRGGWTQLYIIGRDAHTRDPFCLGIPNGFVEHSIDTCLRWIMDLHKGDTIEEI